MKKYIILGLIGAVIYYTIEIGFRGYSSLLSAAQGFVCFLFIGLINEVLSWDTSFILQMLIGGLFITVVEGITGLIFNVWLGMGIWDYSNLPLTFLYGQVNVFFSIAWTFLSAIGIVIDDYIRFLFFNEEQPRYKL